MSVQQVLDEAASEAAALRRFTNHVEAVWGLQVYYKFRGDRASELEVLRAGAAACHNALLDSFYAQALYAQGRFKEALAVLDRSERGAGRAANFYRGYVRVELPGGQERAARECQELLGTEPVLYGLYCQTVLRLLGRKQQAVEACLKLLARPSGFPVRGEWYQHVLDYSCERLSADELLRAAVASRGNQGEAHFFIAMTLLSESDRLGAMEHFHKAMANPMFCTFYQVWSQAFLARLQNDPTWPPWIPPRSPPKSR